MLSMVFDFYHQHYNCSENNLCFCIYFIYVTCCYIIQLPLCNLRLVITFYTCNKTDRNSLCHLLENSRTSAVLSPPSLVMSTVKRHNLSFIILLLSCRCCQWIKYLTNRYKIIMSTICLIGLKNRLIFKILQKSVLSL